jgi:hypothetical protein
MIQKTLRSIVENPAFPDRQLPSDYLLPLFDQRYKNEHENSSGDDHRKDRGRILSCGFQRNENLEKQEDINHSREK